MKDVKVKFPRSLNKAYCLQPPSQGTKLVPLNFMHLDQHPSSLWAEVEGLHTPGATVLKQEHLLIIQMLDPEPDRGGI